MRTSRLKTPVTAKLLAVLGASMMLHSLPAYSQEQSGKPAVTQNEESPSGYASGASTRESGASSGKLSSDEEKIIRQLAQANMVEINAAKLAQEKTQSDEVKSFAKKMVDDHTKALDELKQIAQSKGLTLPSEPNKQQIAMEQKLQGLSGDKFDKQYMKQIGEHAQMQTHQLLQKAAKVKDADLKNYASKTMAVFEGHLQMAKETERSLKATAAGKSGPGATGSGTSGTDSGVSPSGPSN